MVYFTKNKKIIGLFAEGHFIYYHTWSKIFVESSFCQNATLLNDTLSNVSIGQIFCVLFCVGVGIVNEKPKHIHHFCQFQ